MSRTLMNYKERKLSDVTEVTTDLDGKARKVDGDSNGTAAVDMGAYEYQIPYIYDISLPLILN